VFQHVFHVHSILLFVGLGAGSSHRGTFSGVKRPELNSRRIDDLSHLATQSIDLSHQMTLCQSTDRRIARHECDRIEVKGEQKCRTPHASSG
jgi:hypothetical protein